MDKELEFIESLYDEAEEQIKEVYKEQKKNRDELLREIAMVMLIYTVLDSLMNLSRVEKVKEYNKLSKLIKTVIKGEAKLQVNVIENILMNTVDKTFNFYSYNANLKDVRKIIENNYKDKHFSTRVWENEKEVAKKLHKLTHDFLDGKINVNQIKKEIEKTFNNSAYEVKRLVETEIARCEDEAFKKFCKETGVEKVKRIEVLDIKICDECEAINGVIFDLKDAPGHQHPFCRGYNSIYK